MATSIESLLPVGLHIWQYASHSQMEKCLVQIHNDTLAWEKASKWKEDLSRSTITENFNQLIERSHDSIFSLQMCIFGRLGKKHKKKCAYDFETHIGNKQKLSLKQDFLRKTPFLSDPSPIVALSWKSLSPSSCWICWIHVIHHQTLFNLRSWLSLRKSKLVQLSKLSKSLVKIMKLKFC